MTEKFGTILKNFFSTEFKDPTIYKIQDLEQLA